MEKSVHQSISEVWKQEKREEREGGRVSDGERKSHSPLNERTVTG